MTAPREIKRLAKRFRDNRDVYCSSAYNEAQARHEFIDPFFKALGWDVNNEKGYAEAYKEVIHEDAIKVGGATKAPDYCFRIGGVRKFFVEAKRPGVNIKDDENAAYQLRRYAWSAKLALSILTDFEEFAVYDRRTKPAKMDKASTGRVLYLTVDQYDERWDEIAGIFSPESIRTGSFDKYAKVAKPRAEVDTAFLKEIEDWRDVLARNIALRNTELSNREVNFAVQRTIDRIIFLRICEDRGIEVYGQLMALQSGMRSYQRLCQIFRRADERYNSGLFHFRKDKDRTEPPDGLTLTLTIDDKALKGILKELYYPESPYEFSVLPADILGQVYEQFLGKVIRLTPAHRAVVEDKPEVKKAGGVYYTPTYIVDYIVEHTVGKLLEGKTPQQINTLRVLDPACGSGSFLLGAYQTLLDWHLKWHSEHDPEKHARGRNPKIFHGPGGDWRLTTSEKKRILLNNIYGVDIDPQAVEVTKLSLLLKVLEGENAETIGQSLRLFHQRALPDLADNIKCGNSLIGPDFYEGKQLSLIDEEERYRINAFDWNTEFPEIMGAGGFDTVIGNPPYVRQESISEFKTYFQTTYKVYDSIADLFAYFIERSLHLTKDHGLFSYIVSNKFVRSGYGTKIRRLIPAQAVIQQFLDFGDLPVFQGATVYPCIFVLEKEPDVHRGDSNQITVCNIRTLAFRNLGEYVREHQFAVPQSTLKDGDWKLRPVRRQQLLRKIAGAGQPLSTYCGSNPLRGVLTGLNKIFIVREDQINVITDNHEKERGIFLPYLRGRNVHRYCTEHTGEYLLFTDGITEASHPNVMTYLKAHQSKLAARADIRNTSKKWYELRPCQYYDLLRKPKIIYASVAQRGTFTLDEEGIFIDKTCYFIPSNDKYLLGLLNSLLLLHYFSSIAVQRRGGYFEYLTQYVVQLPIRAIDFSNPTDKARHDRMVALVDTMLKLHKDLQVAKTDHEKSLIQRQIDATDKQIDQFVYELYGLTDEEIRIVEEATK